MLTTHRFIYYIGEDGLEIPLFNVGEIEKLGGLFKTDGIKLHLTNHNQLPPYVVEHTKKILKSNQMPQPLSLPGAVSFRFHDKTRDKCLELLNESFNRKHWNKPILTEAEEQKQSSLSNLGPPQSQGVHTGLGAIRKKKEQQIAYTGDQITNAFEDLDALKEKSRLMVTIAEQIKSKLANKEIDGETEEMKEIQAVMFNMGIASDFSTQVSKDTSGKKNFHIALAQEIETFLSTIIDKFGGVVGLIDLYCMYNRARGTDLISPDDLSIACQKLNNSSDKFMVKTYNSGVKTIQSRQFNEDTYYQRISQTIKESGSGMTALKLAEKMNVNVVLMKEHLQAAEMKGAVCRDESYEGVQFFENRFLLVE